MLIKLVTFLAVLSVIAACGTMRRAEEAYGSRHAVRLKQAPAEAARCFARNAEAHSSALVAEVSSPHEDRAEVIVRVKNGVTYATADMRRSGRGTSGDIRLMTRTTGSQSDLLDALLEGC